MNKQESFEDRRGKYVLSGGKDSKLGCSPQTVKINMNTNQVNYINCGKRGAVFSITESDDGSELYFDMENCEVYPLGMYDEIFSDWKRYRKTIDVLVPSLIVSIIGLVCVSVVLIAEIMA